MNWSEKLVPSPLTPRQLVALEPAAQGAVSGTLAEWPHLRQTFKECGLTIYPDFPALAGREMAKLCLAVNELKHGEAAGVLE